MAGIPDIGMRNCDVLCLSVVGNGCASFCPLCNGIWNGALPCSPIANDEPGKAC